MESSAGPANRRALLIGIDRYPMLQGRNLSGCVNDAQLWRKLLQENFCFPAERITLLQNEEATRTGILQALDSLVESTEPGDIVVLFYAGHGSQMRDREGTKPTGMDETLVPHDSGRVPHENRDITDDEIRLRLSRLAKKTRHTTLIFDCCHSATLHRDVFGEAERSLPPDTRGLAELPPSPLAALERSALDVAPASASGATVFLPPSDHFTVIAACRDEETAKEYAASDGGVLVRHGALTYFLTREILAQARPRTTYRDVFEPASANVTRAYATQHPRCEGALDRALFGVEDIVPQRFVPVLGAQGDQVSLGGGAAHGLAVGSRWDLHPQGSKGGDGPALAQVEIVSASALTACARVLSASASIAPLMRAIEVARPTAHRWSIEVCGPLDAAEVLRLRALLASSTWLKLAEPGEEATARIYLLSPRIDAREGDPVPQLGAVAAPLWAVISRDGGLLLPPQPAAAAESLRNHLEQLVRYHGLIALDNARSALKEKVRLSLLRWSDGAWSPAPIGEGGDALFNEGDRLAIEVRSAHSERVYVTLLALGIDHSIGLLYPPPGAPAQALDPGRAVRIGAEEGFEMALFIPEEARQAPGPDGRPLQEARDYIKLFVTNQEVDFSFFLQPGTAVQHRSDGSPLESLLAQTLGAPSHRCISVRVTPREEWAALTRPLTLRRTPSH